MSTVRLVISPYSRCALLSTRARKEARGNMLENYWPSSRTWIPNDSSRSRQTLSRRTSTGALDGRSTRSSRDIPLSETVRQRILASIRSGEFGENEVLNTARLAEEYGVSRTPVREALVALEQANVLTVVPYRGYLVRPMSVTDARDVYFMRELIETAAAARAAVRLSEQELQDLEEFARERPSADMQSSAFDERSYELHRRIARAAGSPRLLASLELLFSDSQRVNLVGAGLASWQQIAHDHDDIIAALRERNPDKAQNAMREHLRALSEGIVRHQND
ncbi:hypothetical protein DM794_08825 [Paenarthrobacter ureafaciens]|uniref:GntR family transcriptional regulator n=2 Tax=Paenarthrobacter ureafaciens TaxID=37931 RepID=UPI00277B52DD|nr:GntR family transcriptional regulator [Paenarthrobacter ureafaciens]NWL27160.1 hypothetical protein [Paenarthrobacter ureafaciens]